MTLNWTTINKLTINKSLVPTSAAQGLLSINGLDIATGNIKATNISDSAESQLSAYDIPQNNGRGFLSFFNRWRNITMTVYVKWNDKADFIANIDLLRKNCYTKNSILDWKIDWEIRRIRVNCSSFPQTFNHYNIDWIKLEIWFTCLDPFWYKIDNQSTSIFQKTESFREEITNQWTATSEINAYFIFGATDTTELKMKVWDEEIILNYNFSWNEIVKIDGENKLVLVNDVSVDYSWIFPELKQWTNFFDFTIDWTFIVDVFILNKKNFV